MPSKIPETSRAEVIQTWLQPQSRNKVAAIFGISPAAVSGIIDEWKRAVGVSRAEQLRDLATTIERHGISVTQCAQGYRIARHLSNLAVDEDEAESFLGESYNRCIGIGISPRDIASHLKDLVSFAVDSKNLRIGMEELGDDDDDEDDDNGVSHTVPSILQIAKYLEKTKEESKKSALKNKQLKNETELLEAKKSSIMQETAKMLDKHDMTVEKLDRYLDIKTELLASGHSENGFELVLKAINLVKENGNNLLAIAAQFSEHEQLKSSVHQLHVQNSILERNAKQLEEEAKISEQIIESRSQMQWLMVKLEAMGFDFKQLKRLYNVVKETAEANGFSEADGYAVKMFLDQVERNYDTLLGFEKRIGESRVEFHNLNMQHLIQLNTIYALPYVGSALARLLNGGLQEDQIVKLANIWELHPDMIQSLLQNSSGNEGQQQKDDDYKSISSLSSLPFSYSPSLYSSSSPPQPQSSSPSQQPQSPQTSTGPTFQKSSSTPPLTAPYSTAATIATTTTTKPSVDGMASETITKSDIRSFAPSLLEQHPPMKKQHNSPGVAAVVVAPKQGESTLRDKSSQPADMRPREDNQNQDQINPTLAWGTPTFLGKEISIPKSTLFGTNKSNGTREFLLDTSEETAPQSSNQSNYSARDRTTHFPSENISALKTAALSDALGNSMLPAQESSQIVLEESIRNQALRSSRLNSDQIETLPVVCIIAGGKINNNNSNDNNNSNNSDPPNLPLNVLDGNFETSWSNKKRGSWLSLDLGTTKNIQGVAIAWYLGDSFDYYYSISLSNDGIIFTEVKSGSSGGNSRSFQRYLLKSRYRARHIKITVNGNNMSDMGGITQVEVLGSNLDS